MKDATIIWSTFGGLVVRKEVGVRSKASKDRVERGEVRGEMGIQSY